MDFKNGKEISNEILEIMEKQGFFDLSIPDNFIKTFKMIKEISGDLSNLNERHSDSSQIQDVKSKSDALSIQFLIENIVSHFQNKIENIFNFLPVESFPDIQSPEIEKWQQFLYDYTGENNKYFYSIYGILQNSENMKSIYEHIKAYQHYDFEISARDKDSLKTNPNSSKKFLYCFQELINSYFANTKIKDEEKIKNLDILCSIITEDKDIYEESKQYFFNHLLDSLFINDQQEHLIFSIFNIFKERVDFRTDFQWQSLFYKSHKHKDNVTDFTDSYLNYFLENKIIELEELNINKEYNESPINCVLRHMIKFHRQLTPFILSKYEKSIITGEIKNEDKSKNNKRRI